MKIRDKIESLRFACEELARYEKKDGTILFLIRVYDAVIEHHKQKADDRCWMDDSILYTAAGLPQDASHRCVGDKVAMRANCDRFIELRCGEGKWPTYAELEAKIVTLRASLQRIVDCFDTHGDTVRGEDLQAARDALRETL